MRKGDSEENGQDPKSISALMVMSSTKENGKV